MVMASSANITPHGESDMSEQAPAAIFDLHGTVSHGYARGIPPYFVLMDKAFESSASEYLDRDVNTDLGRRYTGTSEWENLKRDLEEAEEGRRSGKERFFPPSNYEAIHQTHWGLRKGDSGVNPVEAKLVIGFNMWEAFEGAEVDWIKSLASEVTEQIGTSSEAKEVTRRFGIEHERYWVSNEMVELVEAYVDELTAGKYRPEKVYGTRLPRENGRIVYDRKSPWKYIRDSPEDMILWTGKGAVMEEIAAQTNLGAHSTSFGNDLFDDIDSFACTGNTVFIYDGQDISESDVRRAIDEYIHGEEDSPESSYFRGIQGILKNTLSGDGGGQERNVFIYDDMEDVLNNFDDIEDVAFTGDYNGR